MLVEDVINTLDRENWIIETINNISKGTVSEEDRKDLQQEIYLRILTSTTTYNTIQRIQSIDEIKYYLTRAISLEVFSDTSYFNQKYGRYNKRKVDDNNVINKFYELDET